MDLGAFGGGYAVSTNGSMLGSLESSLFRFAYKSAAPALAANKLALNLGEANVGYVKEGKNTIVAFYDLDGNGAYTAGEPFGCASGVNVSWRQGAAEIELTDTSPIITRADLLTGSTDRHVHYGADDGDNTNLVAGVLSGGTYQRLRVVRTLVNDYMASTLGVANRVLVDKWVELEQRSFFYEGDVLENGALDLDWAYFENEVLDVVGFDPTEVSYRIVLGNGSVEPGDTNNLFSVATVRHFDADGSRRRPKALTPGKADSVVFAAKPTFTWTMSGNKTYTAFKVEIRDTANNLVWSSGVRRAPSTNLDGVYSFTADASVGDELKNGKDYTWRVSMYNAKFKGDYWSSENPSFRMNAPTGIGYGTLPVCVKYFGPADVASKATFVVEAFETPDFNGAPAARTVVASAAKASVTAAGAEHEANAVLAGLPVGKYYVRAYADFAASLYGTKRVRDAYEAWGYACARETSLDMPFTPAAVAVSDTDDIPAVDVYIEDTDVNGNRLPDAWEIVKNDGSLYNGANGTYDVLLGNYPVSRTLSDNLNSKVVSAGAGSALGSWVAGSLNTPAVAALAAGVDPSKIVSVAPNGVITVESEVEDVEITRVEIVDGQVVIEVSGTPADGVNGYGVLPIEQVVTCKVYRKAALDADWGEPVATQTIAVGGDATAIDVGAADDSASAFFKVVVE